MLSGEKNDATAFWGGEDSVLTFISDENMIKVYQRGITHVTD